MKWLVKNKFIVVIFHLLLAVAFLNKITANIVFFTLIILSTYSVIKDKESNFYALYWSAYWMSSEVLFRMSESLIFHEIVKYWIMFLIIIALFNSKYNNKIPIVYVIYILLLLIGIAFSNIPSGESIRKAISFNLSGPILLGVVAIYTYNKSITYTQFKEILWVSALPITTTLGFLFLKTPNLSEILFATEANHDMSGGYGPNQVSTILGFGMFIIATLLIIKKRLTNYLLLDILFLIYITFRGLMTFSRGGMLTAFIALFFFSFFYIFSQKNALYNSLKYFVISIILLIGVWIYTSQMTGGMIVNRYLNKNSIGIEKEDITTGRADIIKTDINYFIKNPIFGIGVGSSKYERINNETDVAAASHNELGRLLSEHGLIGLLSFLILIITPLLNFLKVNNLNKGFIIAFFILWLLTINHSAMRIAFPGFIYGLSLLKINYVSKET